MPDGPLWRSTLGATVSTKAEDVPKTHESEIANVRSQLVGAHAPADVLQAKLLFQYMRDVILHSAGAIDVNWLVEQAIPLAVPILAYSRHTVPHPALAWRARASALSQGLEVAAALRVVRIADVKFVI